MIKQAFENILDYNDLSRNEAYECMNDLISGDYPDTLISAFLIALRMKGETIDEITGLTESMKDNAIQINYNTNEYLVESCGTGGDILKTFNVSTTSSIVASACGAKISKHGNRSVSSKFGGADALEALGVNIELSPEQVVNSLNKCNFAFIFAPKYHVATKNVMKIRQDLKTRTIFNLIGPITCPSNVTARLSGVYTPDLVETFAEVSKNLGVKRGMIVHGFDENNKPAMDEISNIGKTKVAFIEDDTITTKCIIPEDFGLECSKREDILAPDNPEDHVKIINNILDNVTETKEDLARMNLSLMNSAGILYVANKVSSLEDGVELSRKAIENGRARKQLEKIIKYSNEY